MDSMVAVHTLTWHNFHIYVSTKSIAVKEVVSRGYPGTHKSILARSGHRGGGIQGHSIPSEDRVHGIASNHGCKRSGTQ